MATGRTGAGGGGTATGRLTSGVRWVATFTGSGAFGLRLSNLRSPPSSARTSTMPPATHWWAASSIGPAAMPTRNPVRALLLFFTLYYFSQGIYNAFGAFEQPWKQVIARDRELLTHAFGE